MPTRAMIGVPTGQSPLMATGGHGRFLESWVSETVSGPEASGNQSSSEVNST